MEATLAGGGGPPPPAAPPPQPVRLQRRKATQWEKWNIGDALLRKRIDQGVIVAFDQVVVVLHTDNLGQRLRLGDLPCGDVAQTDVAHQALALELDQARNGLGKGALVGLHR
ncbi:hypothetical protein XVE_2912 [Xanthomonas vesicatoria ATCC 35937]|uniref:Uncharacterized protein n=1 Tax=Xanthomonas vesicatoria ATCC 35937 TaxID=925775 RepID=F0BFC6_9XANT|nr:hypothetical protein XVE_2912 [Xanthomonas vesicatoria ATCC 35937]